MASCVSEYVVQPITSFFCKSVKDIVLYTRNYEGNVGGLKEKLRDVAGRKEDVSARVCIGRDKLENITKEAASWLSSVRRVSKTDELRMLILHRNDIAEEVFNVMEGKDLKKMLMSDGDIQRLMMVLVKEIREDSFEKVKKVVVEVMEETMEEFRGLVKGNKKVAMVATRILRDEDLVKLGVYDEEMGDVLHRARVECEENSWEMSDSSDDDDERPSVETSSFKESLRRLVRPLGRLPDNKNFMESLPEDVRFGVEVIDALWKGSVGLRDEMADGGSHGCCSFVVVPFRHYYERCEMSKIAEDLTKQIGDILGKAPTGPVTLPRRVQDLRAMPSGFLKGLESREELLRQIWEKLIDDKVNAVGIYGMGGTGKTTLAKEVANSGAKSIFKRVLMVEVSETLDIESIQNQLAAALKLNLHDVRGSYQRALLLYNRLKGGEEMNQDGEGKGKEITLIILDNMWQKLNLQEVGIPCESKGDFCCKILVTSREKAVCQLMGINNDIIFLVELLNEQESEKLFYRHVGEKLPGNSKSITQRLLRKCDGLSLTIVATANALKGKDLPMWKHFADELEKPISSQISSVHHKTNAILETSYKVLESEEKKFFFLLACLFPRGSAISIDNLMSYGIGLGLFQYVNKLTEALEQAETWVTELISSSLLLEGDSQRHVKIHDVVRASAISFAEKDKHIFLVEAIPRWMWKETFNKYTAISLLSGHDFYRLNEVKAEMLQVLLLKGNSSNTSELSASFFQGMENLKVLHLSYMNLKPELPDSMRKIKNLKILHLEKCKLGKIGLICELSELLVVSLHDSVLEELPDEMGKLVNLCMLDMSGCKVSSPATCNVIASLPSLEGLGLFENFKEWAIPTAESNDGGGTSKRGSIAEFHELPHLSVLEVQVEEPMHLQLGHFSRYLDNFHICIGDRPFGLEDINRPSHCRALGLFGTTLDNHALKESNCLEVLLKRADCLRLVDCTLENNIVPELGLEGFRDLKYLQLFNCYGTECIFITDGVYLSAFKNLEFLELKGMHDLKLISKGEAPPGMFSNLRHLRLIELNLEYALSLPLLPRNLTEIVIHYCQSLRYIFNENDCELSNYGEPGEHKEKDKFNQALLSLQLVDIFGANALVSLLGPSELSSNPDSELEVESFFNKKVMCPSLKKLCLHCCEKIKHIWSKELDMSTFQNLKKLDIASCSSLQSLGSASVLFALVQLKFLRVGWCVGMKEVITKETDELEIPQKTIEFQQLRYLHLEGLRILENFYGGSYKVKFPKVTFMYLRNLPKLTAFLESEDSTIFSNKIMCPTLEQLHLYECDNIEYLWSKEFDISGFRNLIQIEIRSCKKFCSLGLASAFSGLMQLESLGIRWCESIKNVITEDAEELEIPQKTIKFRQLRVLHLEDLKILESLYGGSYILEFPKLKQLKLCKLPKLAAFVRSEDPTILFSDKVEFPYLEDLEMIDVIKDTHTQLWKWDPSSMNHAPKLRKVTLDSIKGLRLIPHKSLANISSLYLMDLCRDSIDEVLFSTSESSSANEESVRINSSQLPKLEQLCVKYFQRLENLFDKEDNGPTAASMLKFCTHMRQLELQKLPKLKLIPLHLFKNLRCFCIAELKWKYVFPSDLVVSGMKMLEEVDISNCPEMDVVIQDEQERGNNDRGLMFPRLKTLRLNSLSIRNFSSRPGASMYLPLLVKLTIKDCGNLTEFWSGPLVAPELEDVSISKCNNMQWFLSGNSSQVVELLSLRRLSIYSVDKLQSFSARPLNAPKLRGDESKVYIGQGLNLKKIIEL